MTKAISFYHCRDVLNYQTSKKGNEKRMPAAAAPRQPRWCRPHGNCTKPPRCKEVSACNGFFSAVSPQPTIRRAAATNAGHKRCAYPSLGSPRMAWDNEIGANKGIKRAAARYSEALWEDGGCDLLVLEHLTEQLVVGVLVEQHRLSGLFNFHFCFPLIHC